MKEWSNVCSMYLYERMNKQTGEWTNVNEWMTMHF